MSNNFKFIKIEPPSQRYRQEDVLYVSLEDCPIGGIDLEDKLLTGESFNMEDLVNARIAIAEVQDYGSNEEQACQALHEEVAGEIVELLNLVQPHLNGAEPSAESTFSLVEKRTYSFSSGQTPPAIIEQALKDELGDKPYSMTLSRSDEPVVVRCVNQGIDSHLEGITGMTQERETDNITGNRLKLTFSHKDMLVLLRRLEEDDSDEAFSLRSTILESLGIEEV